MTDDINAAGIYMYVQVEFMGILPTFQFWDWERGQVSAIHWPERWKK